MDRRIKKTKMAIYTAYFRIKRMHPQEKPSVKEICAFADINKTTFYRHFADMDCLIHAIIVDIVNELLIKDIEVENLLIAPEVYFKQVLNRYKPYDDEFTMIFNEYSNIFIFESENCIKRKLVENTDKKYDDVLLTFIAGGAVNFFVEKNYYDEKNLEKFCRIIKAIVSAI